MRKIFTSLLFVAGFTLVASGSDSFLWTGTADAYWTNAANWTVGGSVATRCPGVCLTGTSDEALVNDYTALKADVDTALFEGALTRTSINLDGLFSIHAVTVQGAATPSVTFGVAEGQALPIADLGTLTVASSVRMAPKLPFGLLLGKGCDSKDYAAKGTLAYDCADPLHIQTTFGNTKSVLLKPSYYLSCPHFSGSGDVYIDCPISFAGISDVYLDSLGTIHIGGTFSSIRTFKFRKTRQLEVTPSGVLSFSRNINAALHVSDNSSSVRIYGGGAMSFANAVESDGNYSFRWMISAGFKAVFEDVYLTSRCDNSKNDGGLMMNFSGPGNAYGSLELQTTNTITGPIKLYSDFTLRTPKVGAAGEETPIGSGSEIIFARRGTLAYTGTGETMTRPLAVTNWANAAGSLMQAGSGTWTVSSPITARQGNGRIVLKNETEAPAVFATALADVDEGGVTRQFSLEKFGPGNWTLTGANTYTGETRVDGGRLTLSSTASIETSCALVLTNGAEFVVESGRAALAFGKLAIGTGDNALILNGQMTFSATEIARSAGTLNIIVDDRQTTVSLPTLAGQAPTWLTYCGSAVTVADDGTVVPVETLIAGKGDVVPNSAESNVSIAYTGTGANSVLAADTTTVASLAQCTVAAATLALGAGQTLITADKVAVNSLAGSLTIGETAGQGVLSVTGTLRLMNAEPNAALTVNAKLSTPGEVRLEGKGPVTLAGGAVNRPALILTDGELRVTGEETFDLDRFSVGTNSAAASPKLVFDGAKDVRIGTNPCVVGFASSASANPTPLMVVTNSLICNRELLNAFSEVAPAPGFTTYSSHALQIGDRSTGELHIRAGAVITNRLLVGNCFDNTKPSGMGGVWQDGGEMAVLGRSDGSCHSGSAIGNRASHGGYVLEGGRLVWMGAGGAGGYSTGILLQRGGEFVSTYAYGATKTASFCSGFGNSSRGQIAFVGGTAQFANSRLVLCSASRLGNGESDVQVAGAADVNAGSLAIRANVTASAGTAAHVAKFTLAEHGCLTAVGFTQYATLSSLDRFWVNFNGGELKLASENLDIFKAEASVSPVYATTLYAGGLTLDTNGKTGNYTAQSLLAPYGNGVVGPQKPPFPVACKVCPTVYFTGDGVGATAYPLWDQEKHLVTNIVVTCPGSGYTTANLVLRADSWDSSYPCTLAPNVTTGGFTKKGAGDFAFKAANTYGGATVLEGGSLVLAVADALPASTVIVPKGGVLEAAAEFVPTALTVDVSGLNPRAPMTTVLRVTSGTLASEPTVTCVGSDDPAWYAHITATQIAVGYCKGLKIFIR